MADLTLLHPEFKRRNDLFVAACWEQNIDVGYTRVFADYKTQKWYYDNRHRRGIAAANPDAVGSKVPSKVGDFRIKGSYHQRQADGYVHAIDYSFHGCSIDHFHGIAAGYGIRFPIWKSLGEWWHAQWFDARGVYAAPLAPKVPAPKEDDDMPNLIIQPDDGDPAVFFTDGVLKTWVRDGNAIGEAVRLGVAKAALDGTPVKVSRGFVASLALVGGPPLYNPSYSGPKTTS